MENRGHRPGGRRVQGFEDLCVQLTQRQLKALGARRDPQTGRYDGPSDSTFHRALNAVVANPQVREQLLRQNVDPAPAQTPQQFQSFIESEYERWGKTIRGANIRAE